MDPLSITVSGMTIVGGVVATASKANTLRSDYKNADKERLQIQRQKDHLQINRSLLNKISANVKSHLPYLDSCLADIEAALPSQPPNATKRTRLNWATKDKKKAKAETELLKDIEIATSLTILISIDEKLQQLAAQCEHEEQRISLHDSRLGLLEATYQELGPTRRPWVDTELSSQRIVAKVYSWIFYLGMNLSLVHSRDDHRNLYGLLFRWHLFHGIILACRMDIMNGWPRSPSCTLRSWTVIPADAKIVQACNNNDIPSMRELLTTRQAHMTDVTSDGHTLLRFAIRAGHYEAVKFLLDNGANPNQTFGKRDTSPLNNAFLTGRTDIIRLLLCARGDLEYMNRRAWTSIYYIWDPEMTSHSTGVIAEILDICAAHHFDGWHFRDTAGWTPLHRAAAFGHGADIRKLFNLGVINRNATPFTTANWSPVHCAARFGNLSTFQYLSEDYCTLSLQRMFDKRGWSLLHLAAAGGSEEMISHLLSLGLDPCALSDPATFMLPEELDNKSLTPRTIAEHHQHGEIYDRALRAAGMSDQTSNFEQSEELEEKLVELD